MTHNGSIYSTLVTLIYVFNPHCVLEGWEGDAQGARLANGHFESDASQSTVYCD